MFPRFFLHRNSDKTLIAKTMNNINWEANDGTKDLSKTDAPTMRQLAAMQFVARMKEAAEKVGAGFVGGFIDENGNRFMMSNMGEGHMKEEQITEQLEQYKRELEEGGSNWK